MSKKHPITHSNQYYIVPSDCVNGDNVGKVYELWTEQKFNNSSGIYSFSIISGNTDSVFAIESSTGELTINNASGFTSTMNIVVSVTVDSNSMSTTCNIQRVLSSNCVYFDSTASSGGNGTRLTPYTQFRDNGLGNGTAGKYYLYRRGRTYVKDNLYVYNGEASAPITFGAYGSGARPIHSGNNENTYFISIGSAYTSAHGVSLQAFNVHMMDLEFLNHVGRPIGLSRAGKNFTFRRLKLGKTSGLTAEEGMMWLANQVNAGTLYPSNIYGSDLEFYGMTDRGIKIERGGEASNPILFENMKAYGGGIHTYISAGDEPYVTIRYVHIDHGTGTANGPNIRYAQQNIEWCYIKGGYYPIFLYRKTNAYSSLHGSHIRDVIIEDSLYDGIHCFKVDTLSTGLQNIEISRVEIRNPGAKGIQIRHTYLNMKINHVVVYGGTVGIQIDSTCTVKLHNVIAVDNGTDLILANSPEVKNTVYGTLSGSMGVNSNNSTTLTQFVNRAGFDYRPIEASTLLGAGTSLGYTLDADNNVIPAIPSIGAYELATVSGEVPQGVVTIGMISVTESTASIPFTYSLSDQTGFQYRIDGGIAVAPNSSPIQLTGLTSNTAYNIEIRAINDAGLGAWSSISIFTTSISAITFLDGLVSAYNLDLNSTLIDSHGTNDGVNTDTSLVTGRIDGALSYNGSTSISLIPYHTSLNLGDYFTIIADFYPTAIGQSNTSIIISKLGINSLGYRDWSIGFGVSREIRIRINGGTDFVTTLTATLNQWNRVIFRYGRNTVWDVTLNGVTQSRSPLTVANQNSVYDVGIGSQPGTDGGETTLRRFVGNIDNVLIWNRTLSVAERDYLDTNIVGYNDLAGVITPVGTVTIGTITVTNYTASIPYTYSDTDETGYQYRLDGGTAINASLSPIQLIDLTKNTAYAIEVRAVNIGQFGAWSSVANFTTSNVPDGTSVPEGIVTIGVISVSETGATVSFSYSLNDQTGFEYRINSGGNVVIPNTSPIIINELLEGTDYTIEVRAINSIGGGNWSAPELFTTLSTILTKINSGGILVPLRPSIYTDEILTTVYGKIQINGILVDL